MIPAHTHLTLFALIAVAAVSSQLLGLQPANPVYEDDFLLEKRAAVPSYQQPRPLIRFGRASAASMGMRNALVRFGKRSPALYASMNDPTPGDKRNGGATGAPQPFGMSSTLAANRRASINTVNFSSLRTEHRRKNWVRERRVQLLLRREEVSQERGRPRRATKGRFLRIFVCSHSEAHNLFNHSSRSFIHPALPGIPCECGSSRSKAAISELPLVPYSKLGPSEKGGSNERPFISLYSGSE